MSKGRCEAAFWSTRLSRDYIDLTLPLYSYLPTQTVHDLPQTYWLFIAYINSYYYLAVCIINKQNEQTRAFPKRLNIKTIHLFSCLFK